MITDAANKSVLSATAASNDSRRRVRKMFRWAEHMFAGIGAIFLIYHLGFEVMVMTSGSMAPALQGTSYENGDRILVEKVTGLFRLPRRFEIYCFYEPDGTLVAKRVIGLPGERISIKGHQIYINDAALTVPAWLKNTKYYGYGNLERGQPVNCGPDYFVLGDDSIDSNDSRYIGPVNRDSFRGRAWYILSPRAHTGFVK